MEKQNSSPGCMLMIIGGIIFIILAVIKFYDDSFPVIYLILSGLVMVIGAAMNQSENIKAQNDSFKRSGIDPKNFIESGKYISGHINIDEPIEKTFLYLQENVLKIYEYEPNSGMKFFKANIDTDKIKGVFMEDETTISSRVGLKRMLAIGLFAFAVKKKKKNELAYLVIEWSDSGFDHETVFEFEGLGSIQKANTLRNKLINHLKNTKNQIKLEDSVSSNDDRLVSGDEVAYYFIDVVGEQFKSERVDKSRQELISELKKKDIIILEREPDNPYDENAIVVLNMNNEDIGYIPKNDQSKLLPYLGKSKYRITTRVSEIENRHDGLNVRLKVNVYLK